LKKREGDLLEREMVFGVKRVIMISDYNNKENSSIQCMFCNLLTLVQISGLKIIMLLPECV